MPISDYLLKQYPNCIFSLSGEDPSTLDWNQDNLLPKPTEKELIENKDYVAPQFTPEQVAAQEAAVAALQYRNLRAAEYPPIAEQFDLLYHGGYDAWKAQIQAVKNKYPKAK
jgi:hypothetical protein